MMLINKGAVKTPYKMESITTTANVEKSLTIVAKVSILDVFWGVLATPLMTSYERFMFVRFSSRIWGVAWNVTISI